MILNRRDANFMNRRGAENAEECREAPARASADERIGSSLQKRLRLIVLTMLMLLALVLTACSGGGDPTETVKSYLQAKIDADRDGIAAVLCSNLEANLDNETRTFETVTGAELVDVTCSFDEASSVVSCDGKIVATYGTEDTEFPLTNYRVVQEDGEWKWCGEAG